MSVLAYFYVCTWHHRLSETEPPRAMDGIVVLFLHRSDSAGDHMLRAKIHSRNYDKQLQLFCVWASATLLNFLKLFCVIQKTSFILHSFWFSFSIIFNWLDRRNNKKYEWKLCSQDFVFQIWFNFLIHLIFYSEATMEFDDFSTTVYSLYLSQLTFWSLGIKPAFLFHEN